MPGYEVGWFEVDSANYSLSNSGEATSVSGDSGDAKTGSEVEFAKLKLTKSVDGATPELMFECCRGVMIPSLEIQVVGTAKGGKANYPFLMLRFERLFVSEWQLNLTEKNTIETVDFRYEKVSINFERTRDGVKFESVGVQGWDLSVRDSSVNSQGVTWKYDFKRRGDRLLETD